jgi:predicted HAD superfamily phosphohydrolase
MASAAPTAVGSTARTATMRNVVAEEPTAMKAVVGDPLEDVNHSMIVENRGKGWTNKLMTICCSGL